MPKFSTTPRGLLNPLKTTIPSSFLMASQSLNCRYPFLLLFFLTFLRLSVCATPINSSKLSCSSFDCGNGINISYPFWQEMAGAVHYCGYTGFGISCNAGKPVLRLSDDVYIVKDVDYSQNTLTVVNVDIWNQSCPRLRRNASFENAPLLAYSPDVKNLVFYYNCSSYRSPAAAPLACLGYNGTKRSYVFEEDKIPEFDWYGNCESAVAVPVLYTAAAGLAEKGFEWVLREGLRLNWSSGKECFPCERSGGRCGYDQAAKDIFCFCSDGRYVNWDCSGGQHGSGKSQNLVANIGYPVGFVIGGMILMASLFYCIYNKRLFSSNNHIFSWRKNIENTQNVEVFLENYGSFAPKRYKFWEIQKITSFFKDKIGEGGFGAVFKGKLEDGSLVAVKVLSKSNSNGDQFINEVASIGRTNHLNVVSLLGFCYEGSKRALIYEYMPNGSLEKFIYTEKPCTLGWEKLYKIALGIARGLEYLHLGCTMRILHFDIKPHNILLDEEFCPKISDFGLAKLCPLRESIVSMACARGTAGYIAPELLFRKFGGVSYKSDVFSYGVMVLEMVGGRKNLDLAVEHNSEIFFPHWIYDRLGREDGLGLDRFENFSEEDLARKMVMAGLWCIQMDPVNRPSMSKVVEMLEGRTENLPMPPKPLYFESP